MNISEGKTWNGFYLHRPAAGCYFLEPLEGIFIA